eukprot:1154081-Pelagomonas_calceolata.AAC.22
MDTGSWSLALRYHAFDVRVASLFPRFRKGRMLLCQKNLFIVLPTLQMPRDDSLYLACESKSMATWQQIEFVRLCIT